MIGDVSRTGTYRKAILGNAAVAIQDKVVLDVGAGMLSNDEASSERRLRNTFIYGCASGSSTCDCP